MVIINNKTASATFVCGFSIIPGVHSYEMTAEQLEEARANELFEEREKRGKFVVDLMEDGVPAPDQIKELKDDASAKELGDLIAKVEKARDAASKAAEKAGAEQDPEKKTKAEETAAKAAAALDKLEEALEVRKAEVAKKRAELEAGNN